MLSIKIKTVKLIFIPIRQKQPETCNRDKNGCNKQINNAFGIG